MEIDDSMIKIENASLISGIPLEFKSFQLSFCNREVSPN